MHRIRLAPSSPVSLHNAPRAGEGLRPTHVLEGADPALLLSARLAQGGASLAASRVNRDVWRSRAGLPSAEDAREQQAIADAVDGVIP